MSKGSKGTSSFGYIATFVVLFICLWYLMHRLVVDDTAQKVKPLEAGLGESSKHVQHLISKSAELLKEVMSANVTLSDKTMHDIEMLSRGKNKIELDISELRAELRHVEDSHAHCLGQKFSISQELTECKAGEKIHRQGDTNKVNTIPLSESTVTTASLGVNLTRSNWLIIGIPTVSRLHGEDYLLQSLETLVQQLPTDTNDLLYGRILVIVVNVQINTANHDKPHEVYNTARKLYAHPHPQAIYFEFIDLTANDIMSDPVEGRNAKNDKGNANQPGYLVRRQTRNIVSVVRQSIGRGQYYLFLEDDMQFCPNGLLAIQYLLSKASRYHPNWLAIRASYGMNGIFMHNDDLSVFADYLIKNQVRRPPDHLVVEWYAGESKESNKYKGNRANIGFKYNLFNHIGVVSTLRLQHQTSFPRCYEPLMEPTVFQVEAYNPRDCPRDDIWPCKGVLNPDKFMIDWSKQLEH